MRQPPLSERGATKWRGMFRNNQKSPYRKIANSAMVITVPRKATRPADDFYITTR